MLYLHFLASLRGLSLSRMTIVAPLSGLPQDRRALQPLVLLFKRQDKRLCLRLLHAPYLNMRVNYDFY